SLASFATGLPPSRHGLVGHYLWLPELGQVVNSLKWQTPGGRPVDYDTRPLLPNPNLWERLAAAGREPITVQPGSFLTTPLTRAIYRGCRFEPAWSEGELVEATVQLASTPGRLIFTYFPHVDFAAHVFGQRSQEYRDALVLVALAWERIADLLPAGAVMVGTADHGLLDFSEDGKRLIREPEFDGPVFSGDPRSLMVHGDTDLVAELAGMLPARAVGSAQMRNWWGPGPAHPALDARAPAALLLADDGALLLPRGFDKRLVGYHGGLTPQEVEVPVLVAGERA
ncbi:MAG: alkaline phosphatase family protein, partial [Acidimicrobiia bacterium]